MRWWRLDQNQPVGSSCFSSSFWPDRQPLFERESVSVITPSSSAITPASAVTSDFWDQRRYGLSLSTWVKIGVLLVLFAALFWPNLRRLWQKTNPFTGEGNWEHAIFIPLIGLYYLYVNSEDLLKRHIQPLGVGQFDRRRWVSGLVTLGIGAACYFLLPLLSQSQGVRLQAGGMALMIWGTLALLLNWGVATVLFGIGTFAYGIWPGQNDYVKDLGMVITLFGVVLALCGWDVMKIAWFPIAFLIFALPWPGLVYSWVAMPLQEIAAQVAVAVLQVTGVDSSVNGTKIIMTGHGGQMRMLNVAEACAGLKSLMTFLTVGAAMAFLTARPLWQRLIIVISAVPIAIFCNTMRVAGQGLLDHYVNPEISQGFAHQFSGLIMLIPAFFMLLLVAWIMDQLFIEEIDDKSIATVRNTAAGQPGGSGTAASASTRRPAAVVSAPPPAGTSLRSRQSSTGERP